MSFVIHHRAQPVNKHLRASRVLNPFNMYKIRHSSFVIRHSSPGAARDIISLFLFFSLSASAQPVEIRRNQVGYHPKQEKVIVVEGIDPTGKVRITTPDGKTLKPKTQVHSAVSPWSGKTRYIVDLGQLTATGNYRVSVGDASCQLLVSERPLSDIAKASLHLFYLIRSGIPIEQGGIYNRPIGHPDTHVLVHNSAATPQRPAGTVISSPYGWYDAGDYNKYVVNSAFSIGLMFATYDAWPDYFAPSLLPQNSAFIPQPSSPSLEIPESGNQTPSLLDEMMFNLRWLLTMQDPSDGGVYHKLTTPRFEGFIMPAECRQPRYVVAKSVTATLDFAAVMADAARLFEPFQADYPGFSAIAAAVSERAYQWAKAHPDAFYRQEQLRDPAVSTGTYSDRNARDEFFWAASALYRLTGRQQYLDDALQYQPQRFTTPSWPGVASLGAFEWLAEQQSPLHESMLTQLTAYCDEAVKSVNNSCFNSPYGNSPRDFGWGCLAERCCCQGLAFLYADKVLATDKYRRYALQNADYLLGRNATGYCYVTGFGDKSPMHPHHRPSASDGIDAPFPGMLVGGPNPGQQDKHEFSTPYPSNYPDESYLDITESYASNEVAINWNASLVAFLSWLDALDQASVTAQNVTAFVRQQMRTYPKSRLLDIYKSCFQDYMGAEHLVADRPRVKAYLDEELNTTTLDNLLPWYYEPCGIDSTYYRVSLRAVKEGLVSVDMLLDAFIRSANTETRPSVESWSRRWHKIMGTIDTIFPPHNAAARPRKTPLAASSLDRLQRALPNYQEDKQFIDSVLSVGKYAISHSPDYRDTYHPHYRIVERNIFEKEIKPLLTNTKR